METKKVFVDEEYNQDVKHIYDIEIEKKFKDVFYQIITLDNKELIMPHLIKNENDISIVMENITIKLSPYQAEVILALLIASYDGRMCIKEIMKNIKIN